MKRTLIAVLLLLATSIVWAGPFQYSMHRGDPGRKREAADLEIMRIRNGGRWPLKFRVYSSNRGIGITEFRSGVFIEYNFGKGWANQLRTIALKALKNYKQSRKRYGADFYRSLKPRKEYYKIMAGIVTETTSQSVNSSKFNDCIWFIVHWNEWGHIYIIPHGYFRYREDSNVLNKKTAYAQKKTGHEGWIHNYTPYNDERRTYPEAGWSMVAGVNYLHGKFDLRGLTSLIVALDPEFQKTCIDYYHETGKKEIHKTDHVRATAREIARKYGLSID